MKSRYKLNSYLKTGYGINKVTGIHTNAYTEESENMDNIQYEFEGQDNWVDEDDVECEMVRKK